MQITDDDRFVVERHTDAPFHAFRVHDNVLDRPTGFGLLLEDAKALRLRMEIEALDKAPEA